MAKFEATIESACKEGRMPGIVLEAVNKDGTFRYSKAFGMQSLEGSQPMKANVVMRIASCTKLLTAISILQCVERGQIKLDDDLAGIVPELAPLEILVGFEDSGKPILKRRKNAITLRRALTHSSGIGYSIFDPRLQQYLKYQKKIGKRGPRPSLVLDFILQVPLLFEPGTDWTYGYGIDLVGKVVERLNNMTLEEYMRQNIWVPLGMKDVTFDLNKRPDLASRVAEMALRTSEGKAKQLPNPQFNDAFGECFGGAGISTSMPEYLKVLHSILSDDEKLLKKQSVDEMSVSQLEEEAQAKFHKLMSLPAMLDSFPGNFEQIPLAYGLGSMVTMAADPAAKGKGTLTWGGMPNLSWFIDRDNGLCSIFGTQIMPPGDEAARSLTTAFEEGIYKKMKDAKL